MHAKSIQELLSWLMFLASKAGIKKTLKLCEEALMLRESYWSGVGIHDK